MSTHVCGRLSSTEAVVVSILEGGRVTKREGKKEGKREGKRARRAALT